MITLNKEIATEKKKIDIARVSDNDRNYTALTRLQVNFDEKILPKKINSLVIQMQKYFNKKITVPTKDYFKNKIFTKLFSLFTF